jgi:hypothetical protein
VYVSTREERKRGENEEEEKEERRRTPCLRHFLSLSGPQASTGRTNVVPQCAQPERRKTHAW